MKGNSMKAIKRIIKRALYGEKADSETYIEYLRKKECELGKG